MKTKTFMTWIKDEELTVEKAIDKLGLKQNSRKMETVHKRYWFWYFVYKKFNSMTLTNLGMLTGKKHCTVMHGIRLAEQDPWWLQHCKKEVEEIVNQIKEYDNKKEN